MGVGLNHQHLMMEQALQHVNCSVAWIQANELRLRRINGSKRPIPAPDQDRPKA